MHRKHDTRPSEGKLEGQHYFGSYFSGDAMLVASVQAPLIQLHVTIIGTSWPWVLKV